MKTIVTIGPASNNLNILKKLKALNASCFRINLSHSNQESLEEYFELFNKADIVPALDTQGAQARLLCRRNKL